MSWYGGVVDVKETLMRSRLRIFFPISPHIALCMPYTVDQLLIRRRTQHLPLHALERLERPDALAACFLSSAIDEIFST
jgi:hypothetical protein